MGIVAQCPNGHRLKVKDQFAGKKVICPHCQAPFRVAAAGAVATSPANLPEARIVPLDPAIVATLPRAYALGAAPAAPLPQAAPLPVAQQPAAAPIVGTSLSMSPPEPALPAMTMPTPAVALPVPWHPLIAEQPLATWSIAWPGGEPSAPMAGDVMQQWLDSRQATGGELVWRSDWPAWLPIAQAFPEYVPPAPV